MARGTANSPSCWLHTRQCTSQPHTSVGKALTPTCACLVHPQCAQSHLPSLTALLMWRPPISRSERTASRCWDVTTGSKGPPNLKGFSNTHQLLHKCQAFRRQPLQLVPLQLVLTPHGRVRQQRQAGELAQQALLLTRDNAMHADHHDVVACGDAQAHHLLRTTATLLGAVNCNPDSCSVAGSWTASRLQNTTHAGRRVALRHEDGRRRRPMRNDLNDVVLLKVELAHCNATQQLSGRRQCTKSL